MILLKWYKEWMDIRTELRLREAELNPKICDSCETLKHQLEISNLDKNKLLDRLLEKPEPVVEREPAQITRPLNIPWNVRRQMLEAEDRAKAKLMRDAVKPDSEIDKKETEAFEKELADATERRTQQTT